MDDEIVFGTEESAPFFVVRVTPLGDDSTPDHPRARTHHFEQPVELTRIHKVLFRSRYQAREVLGILSAFTVRSDEAESAEFTSLKETLGQCRGGAAIEMWSPIDELGTDDDPWGCVLIPHWKQAEDTPWPRDVPKGMSVHMVGWNLPAVAQRWPAPSTKLGHYDITAGTGMRISVESTPPPRL